MNHRDHCLNHRSLPGASQAWFESESVPKLVGDLGEKQAGGIRSWYPSVGQATPTPADIKPLAIPGQVLYPRTFQALIFILPITLSVGLFVQGTSGSSQSQRRSGTASHTDNSSPRSNQWLPRLAFWRSVRPDRSLPGHAETFSGSDSSDAGTPHTSPGCGSFTCFAFPPQRWKVSPPQYGYFSGRFSWQYLTSGS